MWTALIPGLSHNKSHACQRQHRDLPVAERS